MKDLQSAVESFLKTSQKGSLFYADLGDASLALCVSDSGELKYQICGKKISVESTKMGLNKYGSEATEGQHISSYKTVESKKSIDAIYAGKISASSIKKAWPSISIQFKKFSSKCGSLKCISSEAKEEAAKSKTVVKSSPKTTPIKSRSKTAKK